MGINMSTATQNIVNKAWNFAHVLRDDGLSYMAYTEQITFLLFLKMADERTKPPYNHKPIVPPSLGWPSLLKADGDELEAHYRHILEELGTKPGMLGEIFKKARPDIQNPATLKRLIVDLIDTEQWLSMEADVKGDIYEGLLAKSAAESPKGAGQYFTPVNSSRASSIACGPRPPIRCATRPAARAAFYSCRMSTWPSTTARNSTLTRRSTCGRALCMAGKSSPTRPGCAS